MFCAVLLKLGPKGHGTNTITCITREFFVDEFAAAPRAVQRSQSLPTTSMDPNTGLFPHDAAEGSNSPQELRLMVPPTSANEVAAPAVATEDAEANQRNVDANAEELEVAQELNEGSN